MQVYARADEVRKLVPALEGFGAPLGLHWPVFASVPPGTVVPDLGGYVWLGERMFALGTGKNVLNVPVKVGSHVATLSTFAVSTGCVLEGLSESTAPALTKLVHGPGAALLRALAATCGPDLPAAIAPVCHGPYGVASWVMSAIARLHRGFAVRVPQALIEDSPWVAEGLKRLSFLTTTNKLGFGIEWYHDAPTLSVVIHGGVVLEGLAKQSLAEYHFSKQVLVGFLEEEFAAHPGSGVMAHHKPSRRKPSVIHAGSIEDD